ncbi:MAG: YkgJ family cysteine cluster protein [Rubripirellula sp.]|nr:YkgJ family cysteine cluster protein [Rubripirellula sp.]
MSSRPAQNLPTISDCNDCGVCCLHMGYPSYVTESQNQDSDTSQPAEPAWTQLPEALRDELLAYIASYIPPADGQLDGPCVWYDPEQRQCKHHADRPQVCRDFAVGGQDCVDWRANYREYHPEFFD